MVREDSRSIGDFASSLGVSGGSLRNWLKQSDLDTGRRKDGLTSDEREELRVSGARIAIGVLEVMRAAR